MVSKLKIYGKPCDTPAVEHMPALRVDAVTFAYPGLPHPVLEEDDSLDR